MEAFLKLLKGLKDQRKRGCNCRGSWTEGETTSEVPKQLKDVSKSTSQICLLHAAAMLRQFNEDFPLEFSWFRSYGWPPIELKDLLIPSPG